MASFANGLHTLITTWQPFIWIAVAVALVVIGLMFIVPSEKGKNFAKEHIGGVVIGCGIVIAAVTLAKEISGAWGF